MNNNEMLEQRIERIKNIYLKIDETLENLPDIIPDNVKTKIRDAILKDAELKELMEGIENHRAPRFFLIGRTGVGKSSLVNALCNAYLADVSDTQSCTNTANLYQCKDGNRILLEIMDTRGILESEQLDDEKSAEDLLLEQIDAFSPDVAVFVLGCTHRDDIKTDIAFLKKVSKQYEKINKLRLPVVVVVNKCDEMQPARMKDPDQYTKGKIDNINQAVQNFKGIIIRNGLKIDEIVPVSSLIDWKTPDGLEVDAEDIKNLPQSDLDNLQIAFDGRYNIEELLNVLETVIPDHEARMGLRMAFRLDETARRLALQITNNFSQISAIIGASPIPVSDFYVLLVLQGLLVTIIAALSGEDISLKAAMEFIMSLGTLGAVGYALRMFGQQAVKLANSLMPGVGSTISAAIAAGGTNLIGRSAIRYYINNEPLKEVRKNYQKSAKDLMTTRNKE